MDEQIKTLYNDRIMALAGDIARAERLDAPDATVFHESPLCGSRITVDLTMEDGRITGYGQKVRACTLGQAAAAFMAQHVVGRPGDELVSLAERMRAMLREGASPPGGDWAELAMFEPAREFKSRHGSVLLVFEAIAKAVHQIEEGASGGPKAGNDNAPALTPTGGAC